MITNLYIKNFAIIDELNLQLDNGMTVLTGETGAGKSIIIDAIGQLIGDRFNGSMIKDGATRAFIEATIHMSEKDKIAQILIDQGFEITDDQIIISRELQIDGRSQFKLNYRPVTLAYVRSFMPLIIDIHSQHDNQYLLNAKTHLTLLDAYCYRELHEVKLHYSQLYNQYLGLKKDYEDKLHMNLDANSLEFLEFQLNEIETSNIKENELEELEIEENRIKNFEKISYKVQNAVSLIQDEQAILDLLSKAKNLMINESDPTLIQVSNLLESSYYQIDEALNELNHFGELLDFDENQLNVIQNRLFEINKIKRKYGDSTEKINEYQQTLINDIHTIKHYEESLIKAQESMDSAYTDCLTVASKLSQIRKKHAKQLMIDIKKELVDLSMLNVQFEVSFNDLEKCNASGIDQVEFLISLNPGQSPRPLSKVASGGELSRIMLGLKSIFSKMSETKVIIFDEVDTGVSGKVANDVGIKMQNLSNLIQVLCITHLPQVAGYAKNHIHIGKNVKDNQTFVEAQTLSYDKRVIEIAKMLSGEKINELALENAKSLIHET